MTGKRRSSLAIFASMAVAGAVVGMGLTRVLPRFDLASPDLSGLGIADLLVLPLWWLLAVAVHEAGHLLAGLAQGMRFLLFVVGPFGLVRSGERIRFRWFFKLGAFSGLAALLPRTDRPLAAQMKPMALGGPLASLLLALAGAAALVFADGRIAVHGLWVALLSGLIFLATAVPFRAGGFMSDGMQWLAYRRGGAQIQRRALTMALMGQSLSGVRPRDLDPALLLQAQAVAGEEVLTDMSVWMYSHLHALDGGDDTAAQDWARRMAGALDGYVEGFKQSIAVELALFEALCRGRATEARAWLDQSRGGLVEVARRELAIAAVAVLEQDSVLAERALRRAREQLPRGMDAGIAHLTADQIAQLQARLAAPAGGDVPVP